MQTAFRVVLIAAMSSATITPGPGTVRAQSALPELDCLIEPNALINISSPVPGVLESIEVERAQLVDAGQVLASLRADVERASVALARARSEMRSQIESSRTSLEFGRRKLERTEELWEKKAIPFHEKDEVETDVHLAEARLNEALENRKVARLELDRTTAQLNMKIIRSPVRSVVTERLRSPGEYVDKEPILRLAELDPLKVEVIAPVQIYGRITTGMQATVIPEPPRNQPHTATVTIVDRVIDAASGTFGVRLELANPDFDLPGGLRCRLRFIEEAG